MVKICFYQHQLCIRGTTIALFDYANYNEKILKNSSVVLYLKNHPSNNKEVIDKFQKRFTVISCDTVNDIDKICENFDVLYVIKSGERDNEYSKIIPTIIHSVFSYDPHCIYTCVSRQIALKNSGIWLPHIIENFDYVIDRYALRKFLNIPQDAIVLGRYGGNDTFSIKYVKELITEILQIRKDIYFLMCNTDVFYTHPQIIYIPPIITRIDKYIFISTCDAMIHARLEGETFGLAVAEFAICNKMVITSPAITTNDNEHIYHLRDRAIIYNNKEELQKIFNSLKQVIICPNTENPYKQFSPEKVMKIFAGILQVNGIY